MNNNERELSLDFIAGLIVGEGTFYWTKAPQGKIPVFALCMHVRDRELIIAVRDSLGLKEKVYEYKYGSRHCALLIVRNIGSLKNKIIPLIYPRLVGYKKQQFIEWFQKFFSPDVSEGFSFFPNALRRQFPELCQEILPGASNESS